MFKKFLSKRPTAVLAISIGQNEVSAVRIEAADGVGLPRLTFAGSGALNMLPQWKRQGLQKRAQGVLMLAGDDRTVTPVSRPDVADDELIEAVRWQVAGTLDYSPEEMMIDVIGVPPLSDSGAPQALAIVARASVIKQRVELLAQAGLQIHHIDVVDMAQRNLCLLATPGAKAIACLGFHADEVLVSVVAGQELCVARNMPLGNALSTPVEDLADRLGLQLQRSLDLFERQATRFAINRVLLLESRLPPNFQFALQNTLTVPVEGVELVNLLDTRGTVWDCRNVERCELIHLAGLAAGRVAWTEHQPIRESA